MRTRILFAFFIVALICGPSSAQNTDLKSLIETGKLHRSRSSRHALKTPRRHIHHDSPKCSPSPAITQKQSPSSNTPQRMQNRERSTRQSNLRRAELLELTGQEAQARRDLRIVSQVLHRQRSANRFRTDFDRPRPRPPGKISGRQRHCFARRSRPTPNYLEAQLSAAELFTTKYNYADAAEFLDDALKLNPKQRPRLSRSRAQQTSRRRRRCQRRNKPRAHINPNYVDASGTQSRARTRVRTIRHRLRRARQSSERSTLARLKLIRCALRCSTCRTASLNRK